MYIVKDTNRIIPREVNLYKFGFKICMQVGKHCDQKPNAKIGCNICDQQKGWANEMVLHVECLGNPDPATHTAQNIQMLSIIIKINI